MSLFHPWDMTTTSVKVLPAAVRALMMSCSCEGMTRFASLSSCTSKIGMLMASFCCWWLDGLDRAHQIDQPATLKIGVSSQIRGGREKQFLHLLRISNILPPDGQERRDTAAYMRRSHAGAAVLDVNIGRVGGALHARTAGENALAGRHQIGFHAAVAGGPFRGKVGDAVGVRGVAMGGTNRDGQFGVAGIVDGEH